MPNSVFSDSFGIIGLMSGTSLDGLDICAVSFTPSSPGWSFKFGICQTIPYPETMRRALGKAHLMGAEELIELDFRYGHYLGRQVREFILNHNLSPALIASHGHTIFHNPEKGYTLQIGKGSAIAAATGVPCISDFRSGDIARGGQGAPLVPIGDKLLFGRYDSCLNLGGIANISYDNPEGQRVAFDITPCNMLLNMLAEKLNRLYDPDGTLGRSGKVNTSLLNKLMQLDFFNTPPPKSLGREWFQSTVVPIINEYPVSVTDKLRTAYELIALQLALTINSINVNNVLITGGGTLNRFLIETLRSKTSATLIIPDKQLIEYKEALIFAFLGLLFYNKETGVLTSVTGARSESIAGTLSY